MLTWTWTIILLSIVLLNPVAVLAPAPYGHP
jgi:hypothetical protein